MSRRKTKRTKRTRTKTRTRAKTGTRRTRGGMKDNASDEIRTMLEHLFPEIDGKRFMIKETDDDYRINLVKCDEQSQHSQRYTPRIIIYKDGRMHIDRLTSCKPVSGAEIIRRYITLARQLGLDFITLYDESEIYFPRSRYGDERCAIYLPILRILQRGESWYESLGFRTSTSEADQLKNEQVRQMPFGAFVQRLIEKDRQEERERIIRRHALNNNNSQRNKELANTDKKQSTLEELQKTFPEINEETPVYLAIQQMVDHINQIENMCESAPLRMLQKVIDTCIATQDPLIHYHKNRLTLTL